ncbi:murein hydrolase activator EnvC family protein [Aliidiomarina haloalkalitolerans]|uniref:Peptidase M23 n=1 Tax=Aliidiomarina haloalkalitolerans TaxID=859059 RepID=A0A432VVJ1_9GAMM|nr:peptidoglycan DD-metalloendopeptidase family protein [Aliidiomarina haloalkalitolerans]RUO20619.1 peptidase M23 [Aliidiomarina haloalkalitolerans]
MRLTTATASPIRASVMLARSALVAMFLAFGVLAISDSFANDPRAEQARAEQQLAALQKEIQQQRRAIERRQERLSRTERELRELETKVQQASQTLRQTELRIAQVEGHIYELESEQERLQGEVTTQANLLADQIESAYRNGDEGFLKMLLNQQSPAKFERMLAYYEFLNDARLAELEKLHALETQLEQVKAEVEQQRQTLARTFEQQRQQRETLAKQRQEQQQLVARLQREQQSDEANLAAMLRNEKELNDLLAALQQVLAQQGIQLDGLAKLRGQLTWPVNGTMRHTFGQQRSGQIRWRGVVMNTELEAPVRAIADGRVIYSDWLRGFGMVVVIDHGEHYMSLYGYNQALLKNVGEPVRSGEVIALAGQSGGQREASLYFEIRHEGNPINPAPYMRR